MHFFKKHQKGLRKKQTDNAKAMSARAEGLKAQVEPKQVKPEIPKGPSRLAFIAHPKLGNRVHTYITKSNTLGQPKAKAHTKAQGAASAPAPVPAQAPKGAQTPVKAPQ